MEDIFMGCRGLIDFRLSCREEYESKVVSRETVLDIGGRNYQSKSRRRIELLRENKNNKVVSTDIFPDYQPDIVDDICHTKLAEGSFDAVYCDAILEHVAEYWLAIDNIHKILKPGGEAFIYVPFFFPVHDRTDFHRFTFSEVARMLKQFPTVKIMVPGKESGFGDTLWLVITFGTIAKLPKIHSFLSRLTNSLLKLLLTIVYRTKARRSQSLADFLFYYIYLYFNHGFCAYVRK